MNPQTLSGIIWIVFILYWSAAAWGSALTVSSESVSRREAWAVTPWML